MGASLLAMAVYQATSMLNVPASSRAGSLPQVFVCCLGFVCVPNPLWERACSRWRCVRRH
ncbi:hypothetical protein EAH74_14840 [Pseudomonas mandelii]|uniref:Uncharacterized protein n=1 Tax=Pseudomonas mandelii TaxID=75612 RepID=A0A502IBT9_9PSED|nr:hypothetical protein EAH74_14840 [Pseudomonas mandelii]